MGPFHVPAERPPEGMPWRVRELLFAAEEFRGAMANCMEEDWETLLSLVALTKEEVRGIIKQQMGRDDLVVFGQLAQMGSDSSKIFVHLELTREMEEEAYASLQRDGAAQISLATSLGGTRFRVHDRGRALPTRCGRYRVHPDSFRHLVQCYNLTEQLAGRELGSTDFLVEMAIKAKNTEPGASLPFVDDL